MKLNIACVQLNPRIGQFEKNRKIATSLIEQVFEKSSKKPDLVVFPELALTGYNFPSQKAIEPFLEPTASGPTTNWAVELSKKFKCFTLIGYPEKFSETQSDKDFTIYNSAVLVSPSGSIITNYRKSFLYDADYVWGCNEGPAGFQSFKLNLDKDYYLKNTSSKPESIIQTSIGICMDLSPYKFIAPFQKFEFASHCFDTNSKLILCPMAWLSSYSPSPNEHEDKSIGLAQAKELSSLFKEDELVFNIGDKRTQNEQHQKSFAINRMDIRTVNYWILRFFPFLNVSFTPSQRPPKTKIVTSTVVCCNRVGVEDDVMYAGSSSIFGFNDKTPQNSRGDFDSIEMDNPSVDVYGSLGQGEVGVLIREVDV